MDERDRDIDSRARTVATHFGIPGDRASSSRRILTHEIGSCGRPRRVSGHPGRVPDEDQLPGDKAQVQQRRHDTEELDRRLSAFTRHARTFAARR